MRQNFNGRKMGYLNIFILALFVVIDEVSSHDCTLDQGSNIRVENA